jgi:xylose isomerase
MKIQNRLSLTATLFLTFLLGIAAARAGVVQNSIDPMEQEVLIDCDEDGIPEDVLELSGDLHTLITETDNKAGGVTFTAHFQPVNISAVGSLTGDTYRAVGLTRSTDVILGDHKTFTFVNNFYLIGQRSGIKYLVHETFHVTVVGGEVVVILDHADTRCL